MDQRDFVILNFPIFFKEPIPHPEKVIIQFSDNKSFDLGALCYLKRVSPRSMRRNVRSRKAIRCRLVDLRSFSSDRTKHVEKLIRYFSEQISISGKRPATVRDMIGRFLAFMDWADENNHTRIFDSVELAKASAYSYLTHLVERIRFEEIGLDSAISQQERVISVLSNHFNVDDFSHGLPLLRNHLSKRNPTPPPDESRMSEALNLCERLFDGISSFVCNFKKYPYSITVPKHYNYMNDKLWIFPVNSKFTHPSIPFSLKNGSYNFTEGKIYTLEEMRKNSPKSQKSRLEISIANANKNLNRANEDQFDHHRISVAQLALHCFVIMFQAETGMNWSQIVNLAWTGDYKIDSPRQLFRAIKWRANSREIYFEITNSFLSKLKTFLKLREYLLKDTEFPFLFFKRTAKCPPTQLSDTQSSPYGTLKRINPDLIPITNREWRAAKSDWLIRNTDPSTTALILQNSEKTVLDHYAAGSEIRQIFEFGGFLQGLSKSVLAKGEEALGTVDRSIGTCSDYLSPFQTIPIKNITSNCNNLEGCLFCEKFRVHADERDTRKLLSCRYCLEKVAKNFQGEQFYEVTIQPLLNRINALLEIINEKEPKLVAEISNEVELHGELEFYWAQKYQMLLELEVIT